MTINTRNCALHLILLLLPAFIEGLSSNNARRSLLKKTAAGSLLPFVVTIFGSEAAQAKDDKLFKNNPLTNPVLEQLRIWEQVEADNIRYDGELEMGDAGNKGKVGAYPMLLVPILKISADLSLINTLVHGDTSDWKKAQSILNQADIYDKVAFKRTFNKFGDNIYYSDPDRANAYLGGGATPNNQQSIAYLLRNDILTNVENLRAEVDYLLKDSTSAEEKAQTEDLFSYAKICDEAMKKYLELVPPNEIEVAKELIAAEK